MNRSFRSAKRPRHSLAVWMAVGLTVMSDSLCAQFAPEMIDQDSFLGDLGGSGANSGAGGSSSGGGLTSAGSQSSNLGAFSIAINAGVTLAANPAALAAYNRAARQWEKYISDPITISIAADLASLGSGILGSTSSIILQSGYAAGRDKAFEHMTED